MIPQLPAQGILINRDYGDAKHYTVPCACQCDDHTHHVWVEADDCGITVTTYTQQKTKFWEFNRWKLIWTLLTKGYVEYEASIILDRQQALNYANILNTAITDVEEFRKQNVKT